MNYGIIENEGLYPNWKKPFQLDIHYGSMKNGVAYTLMGTIASLMPEFQCKFWMVQQRYGNQKEKIILLREEILWLYNEGHLTEF